VGGHSFAKGGDLLGKPLAGFFPQTFNPQQKRVARGMVKPLNLFLAQFLRELYRRHLRMPQNLI
jgi:hypothetical protein